MLFEGELRGEFENTYDQQSGKFIPPRDWSTLHDQLELLLSLGSFHQLERLIENLLEWDSIEDQRLELNFYLAKAYLGQGKYQEALAQLQNLQRDIGKNSYPQKSRIYHLLADAFFYSNKISEAKKVIGMAEEFSQSGPGEHLDYLYHYFQFLGYERSDNKYVYRFIEQFPLFLELCDQANGQLRKLSVGVSLFINRLYFKEFGLDKGVAFLEDLIRLAKERNHLILLAKGYHTLGHMYQDYGLLEEANEAFSKAVKHIKSTGDEEEMIWILNGAGYFNLSRGHLEEGFRTFYAAIELISDRLSSPSPSPIGRTGPSLPIFITELILTLLNLTYVCLMSLNFPLGEKSIRVALRLVESFHIKDIPFHSFLELYLLLGYSLIFQNKESELVYIEDQIKILSRSVKTADKFRLRFFEIYRSPDLWSKLKSFLLEELAQHPLALERCFFLLMLGGHPEIQPGEAAEIMELFEENLGALGNSTLYRLWKTAFLKPSWEPIFTLPDLDQLIFSTISSSIQQLKAIIKLDRKIQEIELINQYQKTIYSLETKIQLAQETERFLLLNIPCTLVHVVLSNQESLASSLASLPGIHPSFIPKISHQSTQTFYDDFLWDQQNYASMVCVPVNLRGLFLGVVLVLDYSYEEHTRLDDSYFPFISLVASQLGLAQELIEHKINLEEGNREIEEEKKRGETTYQKLRSVQNQLIQSEKMAFLGSLVNGVAQEIQSPLGAIQSLADSLDRLILPMLEQIGEWERGWEDVLQYWDDILIKKELGLGSSTREKRQRRLNLQRELEAGGQDYDPDDVERWVRYQLDRTHGVAELVNPHFNDVIQLLEPFLEVDILSRRLEDAVQQVKETVDSLKRFSYLGREEHGEWFQLGPGLDTVMAIFRHFFRAGVRVETYLNMNRPIYGSPDQLMQVWASLIYSRLVQMDFQGQLTLESWRKGDQAKIRITDDGPPWPDGWKDRLFDPLLFLESNEQSRATGLPLAKRIIDNMGGELTVLQEGNRKGFEVSLPVEKGI
jgi:two-component system NtrC family sensor kinase